jgi:short-subunit dehydrogenase
MISRITEKTSLITGASSGIGETFARQLAAQGYQLILVARREDRLRNLADELESRFSTAVKVIAADLSNEDGIQQVVEYIEQNNPLDLLVNNAGFGMSGNFSKIEIEKHLEMNQVHVEAAVRLTHAAMQGMISRQGGSIINVSSVAAFLPWGNVTYNATKAYLVAFSEALNAESRSKNVRVQALCPGFTTSEFHDSPELERIRKSRLPKMFWLTSDFVVRESLKSLARGQVICVPGFHYRIIVALGRSPITSPLLRQAVLRMRQRSPA